MGKADRNAAERQRAAQAEGNQGAQQGKAAKGVARAMEQAKRGELYSRRGHRISPKSLENLRPCKTLDEMPKEEAAKLQAEGRTKGHETTRRRQTIREICEYMLALPLSDREAVTDEKAQQMIVQMEQATGRKPTLYEAITAAQVAAAMDGNTKAAAFVRDSVGDKPVEQVHVSEGVTDGDRRLMAKLEARLQHKDKKPEG